MQAMCTALLCNWDPSKNLLIVCAGVTSEKGIKQLSKQGEMQAHLAVSSKDRRADVGKVPTVARDEFA